MSAHVHPGSLRPAPYRGRLRIETWDQAPGFPVLREAPADAEFGRGLALVDAITEGRWGWHPATSAQVGKCVWAEISNPIP